MKFFRSIIGSITANILIIISFTGVVFAADLTKTPTSIQNADESVLRASITATATTITLEPLKKWVNGVRTAGCINTPSGFAVIEDGSRYEYISFGTNACSSANVTTLTDVRRGLSPTSASFAAGTGIGWDASAKFRIIDYAIIYQKAAYKDVANTFTESGALALSGSGSLTQPYFTNATVRDTQLGTNPKYGAVSCLSSTGQCYDYLAGNWRSRSGSNVINASTTVAGKAQAAVISNQTGKTDPGSTGAPLFLQPKHLTQSGAVRTNANNSYQAGRIPILNSSGALSASLGGLGLTNPGSGSLVIASGSGAISLIRPGAGSGRTIVSDGTRFRIQGFSGSTLWGNQTDTATSTFSSTTWAQLSSSLTQTVYVTIGDVLMMNFTGHARRSSGSDGKIVLDFQVGNNPVSLFGSGAVAIEYNGTEQTLGKNLSFTLFHRVATGGALTVQPVGRMTGDLAVGLRPNLTFQVIKIQ